MAYLGNSPGVASQRNVNSFTATEGQTTFSPTAGYTLGYVDVYLNGVRLVNGQDYTASNGTQVVLATGASLNDVVEVVTYTPRGLSDGYTKAEADARYLPINNVPTPTAVSDQANSSTGYFDLPAGTTAQRPASPTTGATRFNTDTGSIEFYDGANWISTNLIPAINSVTGTIYAGAASTLTISVTNATDTITVRFSEGGVTIADVNDVSVSSGSASVSVPAAVYGQTAGDTVSVAVLNQDGTPSSNAIGKTVQGLPTGGTITTSGGYRYHTFTSSSSFVIPSGFSATADHLIVAGGGAGGGGQSAGGGGAGGAIDGSTTISSGTYPIVVGAGGAGGVDNYGYNSNNGSNSTFAGKTAIGGGGSNSDGNGLSGGSGGGGGARLAQFAGGSGTTGQGNRGGNGDYNNDNPRCGGGGGGATAPGADSTGDTRGGAGGAGINWKSLGSYYAGGGGGATDSQNGGAGGAGGLGGGGTGGGLPARGTAGSINTGGGGGAGGYDGADQRGGGSGGSGIVIIRYQLA